MKLMHTSHFKLSTVVLGFALSQFAAGTESQPTAQQDPKAFYANECGACHVAYPPEFLPGRSWEKILAELKNHFGDSAILPEQEATTVRRYLAENAADKTSAKRGTRVMKWTAADDTPMRITTSSYFQRLHHEVPKKLAADNPQVKTFSHCDACHQQAAQGSFREKEINIPGRGRWED